MNIDHDLSLDSQLCYALYSTMLVLGKLYALVLADLRLTFPQFLVMLVLWEEDGLSVRVLGDRLGLDSGTLTPMLKRMEKAGHIWRTRDSQDKRLVRIGLTRAGRDLRGSAQCVSCAIAGTISLPLDRLTQIRNDLQAVRRSLELAIGHSP